MPHFQEGDLVFLPAPEVAFSAAQVVSVDRPGDVAEVRLGSTGLSQRVPCSQLRHRFAREDGATSQDNTSLVHMNDATILENLQSRHARDEIYTYTASVLLAMNPYKDIRGLYGEDQCAKYKGKHLGALPPHPYAIADTAYRALVREQRNQGLLISGESGAGKTETAKIVMQFIAFASGASSGHADSIQDRILQAQPILESFGNAVTMRNSNSSRFGKYNRVFFDEKGSLVDAGITTYLLESSRVVTHGARERTYHCFYEMLRGVDDQKLKEFNLERDRNYRLLTSSSGEQLPGFEARDAANFARVCDALKTIGLDEEAVDNMLRVLAGLIHLGDVEKESATQGLDKDEDDAASVEVDDAAVDSAARLLGMDADELCARLTRKKVAVPGRSSFHEVPRSRSQFKHALQSFIKAIYKRLFDRTVKRINDCFRDLRPAKCEGEEAWKHVGILDIYGFENLQRNSFEQLCINLANERLQQYFVENVLRAEQELYKREALPWIGLPLPDAQPVFNAIAQIFKTLDEYSQNLTRGVGNATDKGFCQKVVDEANKDAARRDVLRPLKMTGGGRRSVAGPCLNEGFIIKHYAGQVQYNTESWLDKNNDRLLAECEALICESTNTLVKSLGDDEPQAGKGPLFRSISKKYQKDLESLLDTLSTCNLHYIRCFKPNGEQTPDIFTGQLVLDQVVQCGTIELVKIMHDGYPNRCPFEEITTRFRDLLPERFQRYGMRTFIEALMLAYEVPPQEWAVGMSRLFLKAGQLRALEGMRTEGAAPPAEKLSEIVRGIIRKKWVRATHAVRLCNFLPKFISQIYVQRAQKSLGQVGLLSSRLAPRLLSARKRVQDRRLAVRRRFAGAVRVVDFLQAEFALIRTRRKDRLATALHAASILHVRTRPWIALARERVAEVEKRREAERKREEERRRLEEQKARREQEHLDAEKRQLEEEQARIQAEQTQREEEQRKHEEDLQKALERQREEMRRRDEAESKQLAEERLKIDEERRAFEGEKQRSTIRSQVEFSMRIDRQASPQRARTSLVPVSDENQRQSSTSAPQGSAPDEDDLGVSISNLGITKGRAEMEQTVRRLQMEMDWKHQEILRQMAMLEEQNKHLEMELHEEKRRNQDERSDSGHAPSPSPSLIPLDQQQLPTTPDRSPEASACRKKPCRLSRSGQRFSLLSVDGSASRNGGKAKRHSVAHEAWSRQDVPGPDRLGEAVGSTGDLGSQRRWWAEQRQFLLEDLYCSSPHSGRAPGGGKGFRSSVKQQGRNLNAAFDTTDECELLTPMGSDVA